MRNVFAPGALACLALAACEHLPGAAAPQLTPSPAAHAVTAAAAVPAPADDVQRATSALARQVGGWTRPQVAGTPSAAPRMDAAALARAGNAKDLAAATAALDRLLGAPDAPGRQDTPE